jgi:hypothetical protein
MLDLFISGNVSNFLTDVLGHSENIHGAKHSVFVFIPQLHTPEWLLKDT